MSTNSIKKIIFISIVFFCIYLSLAYSQEGVNTGQMPYAEASTNNFEVLITYDNIELNKESKLTFYISDYKTNVPVENAKLEVDISGIDNSKIHIQPSVDPGIYEISAEFPEIRKYNFLINITSGETSDLIAINDVDLGKREDVAVTDKKSNSFVTIIRENFLFIIVTIVIIILVAFVFYKIGISKRSSGSLNSNNKNKSEDITL